MRSLKSIVRKNLLWLTVVIMAIILLFSLFIQIVFVERQTRKDAEDMFIQIQQIVEKNSAELEAVQSEYRETCLSNAEVIAYVIRVNPSILDTNSIEEFRKLAIKLEVDEIHIFDDTGCIFTGTHPEYYGYTFDSGEQMNFFKPMIEDKSLRLCQDITPNTAEGKLVQYSALWSADKKYIVQVGMYPDAVLEVTEKNELSYIFSLLRGTSGVSMYAIDAESGKVIGATSSMYNGKSASELGIDLKNVKSYEQGAHVKINGVNSYCVFQKTNDTYIGYVIANDQMYSNILPYSAMLALCIVFVTMILLFIVWKYTDRYIVGSISDINKKLRAVTVGDLDERVSVQNCLEFNELSNHINTMISSLLAETDKMSLVLNMTNLHIGVYEYNANMKNVRFTDHVPEIFGLTQKQMSSLASDRNSMQEFIKDLRRKAVEDEENTYLLSGKKEKYVKLEEINYNNATLGIVMDVTDETVSRILAEAERDIDLMTGLYNRRGMERQFEKLFANAESMGSGAIIMIDSDNLKNINDTYGHAVGDEYLRSLANLLRDFSVPESLIARTGGDEFVLLIYGYENDDEVEAALERFKRHQEICCVVLENGTEIPLLFSYGYELTRGRADHSRMLSVADSHMYNAKRRRKKQNTYSK